MNELRMRPADSLEFFGFRGFDISVCSKLDKDIPFHSMAL